MRKVARDKLKGVDIEEKSALSNFWENVFWEKGSENWQVRIGK
jgi:hypothetical protein